MTKYRKGGVYIVRHILETFEKYEYLLIRPQGDWLQTALSGGIRSDRQLQNSKHFLCTTCLFNSGWVLVIKSPSLSFLEEAVCLFFVKILKCENRCFLKSESLG